jgi:hypothetical protein
MILKHKKMNKSIGMTEWEDKEKVFERKLSG